MKKANRFFALLCVSTLVLTGCGKSSTKDNSTTPTPPLTEVVDEADMFTNNDLKTDYDKDKCVSVTLNGNSISCNSKAVSISGTTIVLKEEGTYIFSGTLDDGRIVVEANKDAKPHLILNGVSITSKNTAPLYILEADKVFVTLADGTINTLANNGSFTAIDDNNIDGTVFSKQDLTFNGSGSLTVTSASGHGIVCKDDLVFTGGTYTIQSASHGLDANDSVRITNIAMTMTTGKDGIHAENSDDASLGFVYIKDGIVNISAEGDGISAGSSLQINAGTFDIVSGGGSANASKPGSDSWGDFPGGGTGGNRPSRPGGTPMPRETTPTPLATLSDDSSTSLKALKAAGNLLIKGGTFTIDCADDAVHSNASATISGGTFTIATGDDGFHADDTLTVTGGNIEISKSYEGLEGLHVVVSGGNIKLKATDDGINAAGGKDSSGTGGFRGDDNFGGRPGMGGGMGDSSNGSIVISDGTLYINSSGDGIDANGTLEISGGNITIVGPTSGDTATLDFDKTGVITGGTFIGTGAAGMAQTFSSSGQGVIAFRLSTQSANTSITLKDENGKTLITHEPELSFAVVILSSPEIVKGKTYTVTVGSSTNQVQAN